MSLIYIGGPMTGRPNYNRAAFFQVEEDLVCHGFEVISPARFGDERLNWQQNMRRAIRHMMDADAAVFLPGTASSAGAWTEWTLPRWAQCLFDWRIRLGQRWSVLRCLPPQNLWPSFDMADDPFADASPRRENTSPRPVPREVMCCPRCEGDLILEIDEWDIDTGAPTESNRVWCEHDWDVFCGVDVEQCGAGGYGWMGVTYAVLEWAKDNVSVYPCDECGQTSDRPGEPICSSCEQKRVDEWNAHPALDFGGADE